MNHELWSELFVSGALALLGWVLGICGRYVRSYFKYAQNLAEDIRRTRKLCESSHDDLKFFHEVVEQIKESRIIPIHGYKGRDVDI